MQRDCVLLVAMPTVYESLEELKVAGRNYFFFIFGEYLINRYFWCPLQVLLSAYIETYSTLPPNFVSLKRAPFSHLVLLRMVVVNEWCLVCGNHMLEIFCWLKLRRLHMEYTARIFNWLEVISRKTQFLNFDQLGYNSIIRYMRNVGFGQQSLLPLGSAFVESLFHYTDAFRS